MGALKPSSGAERKHTCTLTAAAPDLENQLEQILKRVPPLLRLPPPGSRCPFCSLSRTGMVELIAPVARNGYRPAVSATYLKRNERARRGIWIIPSENLFRHLLGLSTKSREAYAEMQRNRKGGAA
jgi:hypothetical protein